MPYLLDAIRCLEDGLGTVEDIDKGMQLGCGYPMGPFTLLDFVGLDTTYFIANILFDEFRETRFAPPPLLKRMVLAGHLGKKSRQGLLHRTQTRFSDRLGHETEHNRAPSVAALEPHRGGSVERSTPSRRPA